MAYFIEKNRKKVPTSQESYRITAKSKWEGYFRSSQVFADAQI